MKGTLRAARMPAHGPQQGKTVHFRHVEVGDDQVERLERRRVHGLLAILRFVDLSNADLLERHPRHLTDAVLVCRWHLHHP